ncbi:MAG: hypothetical protein IPM91_21300 [Bacteroidetes bacterium]|nr:hypothetical protein [Bacteroidota bacterium]
MGLGASEQTYTQDKLTLPSQFVHDVAFTKDRFALFTGILWWLGAADYPTGSITTEMIGLQLLTAAARGLLFGAYDKQTKKLLFLSGWQSSEDLCC